MDGLLFACAFMGGLVAFALVSLSRAFDTRDAIDRLDGQTLPLAPWTHHD